MNDPPIESSNVGKGRLGPPLHSGAQACMKDKKLQELLTLVQALSARQRKALAVHLAAMDKAPKAIGVIEDRPQGSPTCPHCGKTHIVRNGHSNGLQRYWCRGCSATFNALTGTPLAHLHLREKWLQQAQALHDGLSLSQVPVLVARDRAGQTADFILEVDDSEHASDKLGPLMAQGHHSLCRTSTPTTAA
ncbi:MAG: IS1 family transposase [Comamonadaceae bacterium]|nr:IS1 family transposase [Comamonadaceae bacterium]